MSAFLMMQKVVFSCLFGLALILPVSPAAAQTNLVRDGDFATVTGNKLPVTWKTGGAVSSTGFRKVDGVNALLLAGASGKGMQLSQEVTVEPRTEYLFTAKVRSPDRIVATVRNIRMSYHQQGQWQELAGLIRIGDEKSITVRFDVASLSGHAPAAQLADIQLRKLQRPATFQRRFESGPMPTPVVDSGKANAAIVYPAGRDNYRKLAEQVQQAIADQSGITLPVLEDTAATREGPPVLTDEAAGQHLILIGRLGINRAMWPAYNRFLDATDGYYPGGDGYVVRTASNVMRNGHNHLILGGSSDAGAARAVEKFIAVVRQQPRQSGSLSLPWLLDVELGGACLEAVKAHDALWAANPENPNLFPIESGYGVVRRWYENAMGYYWTGWDSYRDRARQQIKPVLADMAYTHHYVAEFFVRTFDMVDDTPLITPEERAGIDELFVSIFCDFYTEKGDLTWMTAFTPPYDAVGIVNRHQVSPWMADLILATFLTDYIAPAGDITTLAAFRRSEKETFMRYVVDHQWDTSLPGAVLPESEEELGFAMFRFALENDAYQLFESGNAKQLPLLDRVNHLTGAWVRPGGRFDIDLMLGILASYYGDGRYLTLREKIPSGDEFMRRYVAGIHKYTPGDEVTPQPADDLAGVVLPEMAPQRKKHLNRLDDKQFQAVTFKSDEVFDFAAIRSGFDKEDDYLAINGLITPSDIPGVILSLASHGTTWLGAETARQYAAGANRYFERNGVHLLRLDVLQAAEKPYPAAARLLWKANLRQAGAVSFQLDPFVGTRWERSVLWIRPGLFVVRDTVAALNDGQFEMAVNWRPAGAPSWDGATWTSQAGDAQFRLTPLGDGFTVQQNAEAWVNGEEDHLYLRQAASLNLKKGEAATAWTLMQALRAGQEPALVGQRVGNNSLLLKADNSSNDQMLVVWGSDDSVKTDATAVVLSPGRVQLLNGTHLELNSIPIVNSEKPISLLADYNARTLLIDNPGDPLSISFTGIEGAAAVTAESGVSQFVLADVPAPVASALSHALAMAAVHAYTTDGSAVSVSEWPAEDQSGHWKQIWQYDGMQQPSIVTGVRSVSADVIDLGRVVDLAEIRPAPITRRWVQRPLPADIWVSAGDAAGKVPPPESDQWIKLTQAPTWRPGVRTGNYGETHAVEEDSQVLELTGIQARYIRATGAAGLLYLDRQQRTTWLPITLRTIGDRLFLSPRIWPKFVGRVPHGPDRIALLDADGREVYAYAAPQKLLDVQLIADETSGKAVPVMTSVDARIAMLADDGTVAQSIDLAELHRQFDKEFGRSNTRQPAGGHFMPFAIGRWQPEADKPAGYAVARYHAFSFLDGNGQLAGVHANGSYVQPAVLPNGIDFDGDGAQEQVILGRGVVFKVSGPRNERITEPNGALFFPQVYQTARLPEPVWEEQIDGPGVHLFQPMVTGAPAADRARYIAIVRTAYAGIYDGLNHQWVWTWVPSVPITAAALVESGADGVRLFVGTQDNLLWNLNFSGSALDRPAAFATRRFPDAINGLRADPSGGVLIAGGRGAYRLADDGALARLTDKSSTDILRLSDKVITLSLRNGLVLGLARQP